MISRLTDYFWPQTQPALTPPASQQKTISEIFTELPFVRDLTHRFPIDLPIYLKDRPEDVRIRRIFEDRSYPFCREFAQEGVLSDCSTEELAHSLDRDYQNYIQEISKSLSMDEKVVSEMMIQRPEEFWELVFSKGDFAELLCKEALAGSIPFFDWLQKTGKLNRISIELIEKALVFAAERDHWVICEQLSRRWLDSGRILMSRDKPELSRALLIGALQRKEPLDFLNPSPYLDVTPICLTLLQANDLEALDFLLEEAPTKDIRILLEKASKLNLREGFAKLLEYVNEIELDCLILETAVPENTYWRTGNKMPHVQLSRASNPDQQWVLDALRKEADSRGLRLQPTYASGSSFQAFSSPFESYPAWMARGKWWERVLVRLSQIPAALEILGFDPNSIIRAEEIGEKLDSLVDGQSVLKQMLQKADVASGIFKQDYESGSLAFFYWLRENNALHLLTEEDLKSAFSWSLKMRIVLNVKYFAEALFEKDPKKLDPYIQDQIGHFMFKGRVYVGSMIDLAHLLICFPDIVLELAEPKHRERFVFFKEGLDKMVHLLLNGSSDHLKFWLEISNKWLGFSPKNVFARELKEKIQNTLFCQK